MYKIAHWPHYYICYLLYRQVLQFDCGLFGLALDPDYFGPYFVH